MAPNMTGNSGGSRAMMPGYGFGGGGGMYGNPTLSGQMSGYSGMYGGRHSGTKLTPQENEVIDVAFESFKDDTNHITTDKLREAFEKIDALGDIKDIQLLIDDIDENGDGKIDEAEFRHIMTRKFLGEDDDSSFIHAFEMVDDNKDGFIPVVELRYLLTKEGNEPLSEQMVDELLMFADMDGTGLVDYRNFLRWLSNPENPQMQMRH